MSEFMCRNCNKQFQSAEALQQHKNAKHSPPTKKPLLDSAAKKRMKIWSVIIISIILLSLGAYFASTAKTFPPTYIKGNVEASPPSHVLRNPLRIEVQKHMLEHADGEENGRGGVIINYDCRNYTCEDGLIGKLEGFADEFDFVYIAPYKNMKAKIALTRLGSIKVLDAYDEDAIRGFIGSGLGTDPEG